MRRGWIAIVVLLLCCFGLIGCAGRAEEPSGPVTEQTPQAPVTPPAGEDSVEEDSAEEEPEGEEPVEEGTMIVSINGTEVAVAWEENASVDALRELLGQGPLVIQTNRYGGFEQVGSLPQSLPSDDVRMQTTAGDIVLYASRSVVLFYGSNTWAYTRLGRIQGKTEDEIRGLLDVPAAEIVFSLEP